MTHSGPTMSDLEKDDVTNSSVVDSLAVEPTEIVDQEAEENVEPEIIGGDFGGEDDDNSDSNDSELDRLMDAAIAEAMEEGASKHEKVALEEIPALLDDATSQEETTATKAVERLSGVLTFQKELVEENLSSFDVLRLIKAAGTAPGESLPSSLISLVTSFSDVSDAARQSLVPLVPDLMALLGKGDTLVNYYITIYLEPLAETEPSSHDLIVQTVKALYEPYKQITEGGIQSDDETRISGLISAFETILVSSMAQCRKLFLQGSAFDLVIIGASVVRSPAVRKVAQSCLVQIGVYASEIDEELPDESKRGSTLPMIITTMFGLIEDENEEISTEAIQFLAQDREGSSNSLFLELAQKMPTVIPSLVRRIGAKEPGHVGAPAEYALLKLYESDEVKPAVHDGFRRVWVDRDIKMEEKMRIISGLADSFDDLRKASYKGGLVETIFKEFEDKENAILAMTAFAHLMSQDQTVGYQILQVPGMLDKIVDIFDGPVAEKRPKAAAILTHTLGCYNDDSEAQRSVVAAQLFNPNILPRILKVLDSGDPAAASAAAKLVSEIIADEDGTQSWSYDEDSTKPPPPTPMKDAIITDERALRVVDLLKQKDSAEGALELLCQFCWGNQRGFAIVQKAFEKHVPEADVFFFANLYGKYSSRHAGRMRRHVADAAVNAGALARVETLLELDQPTVEGRSMAVEAYRVILAADCLDAAIGRKNKRLPIVMKRVLEDRDVASFKNACWMIRLLVDEEDQEKKGFGVWMESEFMSLETAQAFLHWLTLPSKTKTLEKPDPETLTDEEYAKKDREYNAEVRNILSEESDFASLVGEAMTNLVPILAPYATHFVGPLLTATNSWNPNSQLMTLLETFAANEEARQSALVPAVSAELAKPEGQCPNKSTIVSWISRGPALATAFYLGGILEHLERAEQPDEDGTISYSQENLQIFEALVRELPDPEHRQGVRAAFFASKPAVDRSLKSLCDAEGLWDAQAVAGTLEMMTRDYPEGLTMLSEKDGVYPALLRLLQDHNTICSDVATMVGRLCPKNLEALKETLKKLIAQLEPPAEVQGGEPKKGKKRKQKKYQPEITLSELLDRFKDMVGTNSEAKRAVLEAGAFVIIHKGLTKTKENQKYALKLLVALSKVDDPSYHDEIVKLLPDLHGHFNSDFEHLEDLVEFAHNLVTPDFVQYLIDADVHRALFKTFTDFPTSVGDMASIIYTNRDLGETEKGRAPMLEVIKESLAREDAFEQEEIWGNAHALRRLVEETEASAELVVEAGAVDYVIRLLKGGKSSSHLFAIGGALAATLAHSPYLPDVRAVLVEKHVPSMIEHAQAKCEEQLKDVAADLEKNPDDDEKAEKYKNLKRWLDILSTSSKVVKGEEVENYVEDFFI